ncbi:MAG TPA: GcrA family cell cycle regulator [Methylocystis sp.]|nr:GcrA family cell cycle regulator [Methylocystis sp.]
MSKSKTPAAPPVTPSGLLQARQDAADNFLRAQDRGGNWVPLPASTPIGFMELRPGRCRWPLGDPRHLEKFRFCGCACAIEAIYCTPHEALSSVPNKPRTPPRIGAAAKQGPSLLSSSRSR